MVLLDLSAAVDRGNYYILLKRLGYEIRWTALGWFRPYLADR